MADERNIIVGFYKGIEIAIDSASVEGGRKTSINQFPNRDTQSVEDLGLLPRRYTLEIVISDKVDNDYFSYRDSLLQALEEKGSGALIHPLYGRVDDVIAVSYSLNEVFSEFGDTTVSVNFEVNKNTGIPQASANVEAQIGTANDFVLSAVGADIQDNFFVTNNFTGNFGAASDKLTGIYDRTVTSASYSGTEPATLNDFTAELNDFNSNINAYVSDPIALSTGFGSLFESTNDLYDSPDSTFNTFLGYFGFGGDDIVTTTAGLTERKRNNAVLDGAVAASALGYAYLAATNIEYVTTLQIDETVEKLDAQYDLVQTGGSSQDVKEAITDMRIKVLAVFDTQRLNTSQIIEVFTTPSTTRLLSFAYYGNDNLGTTIADINTISDVSFIEGDIKVLTA